LNSIFTERRDNRKKFKKQIISSPKREDGPRKEVTRDGRGNI
jgi:hypothetical protein